MSEPEFVACVNPFVAPAVNNAVTAVVNLAHGCAESIVVVGMSLRPSPRAYAYVSGGDDPLVIAKGLRSAAHNLEKEMREPELVACGAPFTAAAVNDAVTAVLNLADDGAESIVVVGMSLRPSPRAFAYMSAGDDPLVVAQGLRAAAHKVEQRAKQGR